MALVSFKLKKDNHSTGGGYFVADNAEINLVLNWYELKGSNLIGEEIIHGISVNNVLELFEAPFWNGIYHCWAVENKHIATLNPLISHEINPKQYAYFVEIYKKREDQD
ncbi:MAG: cloacin immunity family protein [Gammaproteobacteria bacterium]|nr:cloacin immunity family protein [Gammaproteobacteria bacterium]